MGETSPWPGQYRLKPWETERLTAADVVGPDGVVYPDFRRCGVEGGIPDLLDPNVREAWKEFWVNAVADDGQPDDTALAEAIKAASAHSRGGGKSIVIFSKGEFNLSRTCSINASHLVIAGAGADLTKIRIGVSADKSAALFDFMGKDISGTGRPYRRLTKTASRGSTEVWLESSNGLAAGSWIRLTATKAEAGSTMRERYSWPESGVVYDEPITHFGRVMFARVVKAEAGKVTLDRPISHDIYLDEVPELRSMDLLEGAGVWNLTLVTDGPEVTLDPLRFRGVANSWMKGVIVRKPRDWPVLTSGLVNFEYRDCRFEGTWSPIGSGSRAYLGFSGNAVDCLMENCKANDLRHMPIFQGAIRCVVRNCRFSGKTITSPQLHGQFPHDSMVEGCEFSTPGNAYTVDGMATLRHGVEGPRFVLYNNRFTGGYGSCYLPGGVEGHIIAYNRFEIADDKQSLPGVWLADRVWDGTFIGNSMQVNRHQPVFSMQDPSCVGWEIRDNHIAGSNGYLAMGDSAPEIEDNNRFLPFDAALPEPRAECRSVFDWQKSHAHESRLVATFIGSSRLRAAGSPAILRVTRVAGAVDCDQAITLVASPSGILTLPASAILPSGSPFIDIPISVISAPKSEAAFRISVEGPGLLGDHVTAYFSPLETDFGRGRPDFKPSGTPDGWKSASFGIMEAAGAVRWAKESGSLEIENAGNGIATTDGHLGRSGRTQAWQTLDGNGSIIARVECPSEAAKAGLIIADDECPTTEFILITHRCEVLATGESWQGSGAPREYRAPGSVEPFVWLRLTRDGAVFTAWRSQVEVPKSEADWEKLTEINFYQNILEPSDYKSHSKLDGVMHFGVFVSSGDPLKTVKARFEGVATRKSP